MLPFVRMFDYGNVAPVATGIKMVKVLQNNIFILLEDGRFYGRGHNYFYQLGTGADTPTVIDEWHLCLTDVREFWTTETTQGILVRKNDGTWWSTGTQSYRGVGELYRVWTDVSSVFTAVNDTYRKIVMGIYVTLVLTFDNKLYKMGYNSNGEVFTGAINQRVNVLTLTPEVGVQDIGVSSNNSSYVLYSDGTLKGSGNPSSLGTTGSSYITALTTITTGVLKINTANGNGCNYILKSDGLYVFGIQINGQLGDGVNGTTSDVRPVYKIPTTSIPSANIDAISGSNYSAHVRANGIWYYAGIDGRTAGDGITSTARITTWRACPSMIQPNPSDSVAHAYLVSFMIKDGELYGSGIGTPSAIGVLPYEIPGAGTTGSFSKIVTPM